MSQSRDPLNAVAHPTRLRILAELGTGERTPRSLADAIGETLGSVAYHVRALHDDGALVLTGTSQVRGAIAHHYRATPTAGALLTQFKTLAQHAARKAPKV